MMVLLTYPESDSAPPVHTLRLKPSVMATQGRIRVAILGAGGFARSAHLPNLQSLGDRFALQAVVTRTGHSAAAVAKQFGAEVPFMRPSELAKDETPDLPVFQHALQWLKENERYEPDIVVQLWATSPYRKAGDIDKAIALLSENDDADSVRSVTVPALTPFKMWRRDKGKFLTPLLQKEFPEIYERLEPHSMPRQILPDVVAQTGYVNVIRPNVILHGSMYGSRVLPFYHDPETYTEVDTLKDLAHTEHMLLNRKDV
ncbi:MAG: hypothetical protein UY63_C0008G0035 [Parcubacteria group bacterium GW2011_GWA2_51_10]|nr:MAG: hypothetical protein UY63_C0008G0035 [Parcubacteria group bacterium GW2011_GWA2_51_10]